MRLKICGITKLTQALAITELGVDTLGFVCVANSPATYQQPKYDK